PVPEPRRVRSGPGPRIVAESAEPAAHLRERLIAGGGEALSRAQRAGLDPRYCRGIAWDGESQVRQGHARRDTGAADLGTEEVPRRCCWIQLLNHGHAYGPVSCRAFRPRPGLAARAPGIAGIGFA